MAKGGILAPLKNLFECLWAAGDTVWGPELVSDVSDGHRVAASINEYPAAK